MRQFLVVMLFATLASAAVVLGITTAFPTHAPPRLEAAQPEPPAPPAAPITGKTRLYEPTTSNGFSVGMEIVRRDTKVKIVWVAQEIDVAYRERVTSTDGVITNRQLIRTVYHQWIEVVPVE